MDLEQTFLKIIEKKTQRIEFRARLQRYFFKN